MTHALIVGAFGQGNPGDEALLDAAVEAVAAVPGWQPVVATADPDGTRHRVAAVRRASPTAVGAAALRAHALVVAGGTVFKELHPSTGRRPTALLHQAIALASAFRVRGRPVALVGVGAAPVAPRTHRLVRRLAAAADLLVLRDDASAHLLVEAGVIPPVRVGADLAWCGPGLRDVEPRPRPGRNGSVRRVGVAISHLAGTDPDLLALRLADALAPLAADGWSVELEPWQGPGRLGRDALLAHDLARRIGAGASVLAPPADLAEAVRRTATREVVVALRFHAAVVAAASGTPLVAVAHEPKLAAVADRVRQPWVAVEHLADELPVAVAAALASAGPDPAAVLAERRRSAATLALLRLVLAGGGDAVGLEHLALVPDPVPT